MIHKINVLKNKSLKEVSNFKIGGKAKYFVFTSNADEFLSVLKYADERKIPVRVFGGGTNIVFGDGLLNYFFVRFLGGKIKIRNNVIVADAGVLLSKVIDVSIKKGLAGLEKLSGIPGTLGGAVFGNAGAFGSSISDCVSKVEVWDKNKKKKFWISKRLCKFSYRYSIFKESPDYYILRVELKLKKGEKKKINAISREILKIRRKKYSKDLKCPGSFFKNVLLKDVSKETLKKIDPTKIIEGKIPAGYLLEKVGVKGMDFGNVKIADFHANLIINKGNATCDDIKKVSALLKKKVRKEFGIYLEEEVIFIE